MCEQFVQKQCLHRYSAYFSLFDSHLQSISKNVHVKTTEENALMKAISLSQCLKMYWQKYL